MKNQLFAVVALSAIVFLTSSNLVAGQIRRPGSCPTVTPQPNFVLNDYLGKWWIQEKYPAFFVDGGHCATAEHYETDQNRFSVLISQLDGNNQRRDNVGTGRVVGNAHFLERFASTPAGVEFNYWILATDYNTYNVLFRCDEAGNEHDEYLWIFTRGQVNQGTAINAARNAIAAHGLSAQGLQSVDNSNC